MVLDKKYSTSHTLIHLTDKIREQLDSGNFVCEIFVDLQKDFDTVGHEILIYKLNQYGIRGVANNWFSSYLQNRLKNVSVNGFNSSLEHIHCGVPQDSILGPLLFFIYISDFNHAIRYCFVCHFVDNTNLLNYNNSLKRMNKQFNIDLKNLTNWLNANKICLNLSKTEVFLLKSSRCPTKTGTYWEKNLPY